MSAIKKIFVSRSFDESFELGCEAEYEAISDVIKLLRHENDFFGYIVRFYYIFNFSEF